MAILRHEGAIRGRIRDLRKWTGGLMVSLRGVGIRTFPTRTHFFLADFSPHDAREVATGLEQRGSLLRRLEDQSLGPGYMRVTTGRPHENGRFALVLREVPERLR